jgi:polysaccharide biosynthesis protein VpsM
MRVKCITATLAVVLSFLIPSLSSAQQAATDATPAPAPAATEDSGAYSLKGSSVGKPSQVPVLASTDLAASGFAGQLHRSDDFILTAPLPARGAPMKTENGVFFYPSVFTALGYNDNVLGSETDAIKSGFVNIAPELVAEMKSRGDRYTAAVTFNSVQYDSSRNDSYTNHEVWVAGDNYFSQRASMGWAVGQLDYIDPRGSTQRPVSDHPDHWTAPTAKGRFIYGAPNAEGRLEFDVNYVAKRYDNNREYTDVADVDNTEVAGRFFYRIGARSMVLAEVRNAEFDYKSALSVEDNTERRYYLGLTWEATAATTGTVKVGRLTKDFKQSVLSNFSGSSWEASVRWMPANYTAFDLLTSRSTADSTGVGDYLLNTTSTLVWNHKWTGYLGSRVFVTSQRTTFAATSRVDNNRNWGATLAYDVMRWLTIGVDYSYFDRSSTDPTSSFKRNVVMFTANMTL